MAAAEMEPNVASGGSSERSRSHGDGLAVSSSLIRLNVLCLVGATVGVAAVAIPWIWRRAGPAYEETTLLRLFGDAIAHNAVELFVAAFLFVGGTLAAFVTPTGAIPQFIGIIVFTLWKLDGQETITDLGFGETGFSMGFYLAGLSCVLILASLVRPTGIGYGESPDPRPTRLKVVSRPNPESNIHDILRVLRKHEPWLLAWIVAAVLLGTMVAAMDYPYHEREPLTQVEGGVMWIVGFSLVAPLAWNSSALSVNDGAETVLWDTHAECLANGTWASQVIGARALPDLDLVLTITDWNGDGRVGPGDSLTLTATNGTSFADDVTYTIAFFDNHIQRLPPLRHIAITFEFRNGNLHSHGSIEPKGIIL